MSVTTRPPSYPRGRVVRIRDSLNPSGRQRHHTKPNGLTIVPDSKNRQLPAKAVIDGNRMEPLTWLLHLDLSDLGMYAIGQQHKYTARERVDPNTRPREARVSERMGPKRRPRRAIRS